MFLHLAVLEMESWMAYRVLESRGTLRVEEDSLMRMHARMYLGWEARRARSKKEHEEEVKRRVTCMQPLKKMVRPLLDPASDTVQGMKPAFAP